MATITERTIARFIVELFKKMNDKYGGETSVNELRVVAQCYYLYSEGNRGTSVTELSETLGIPISTAHRAVSQLIHKGWLKDSPHPEDGRKRVVELSEQGVAGGLWSQGIEWLKLYSE